MSAKLLKGRYTTTDSFSEDLLGCVRYLDPRDGAVYSDAEGTRRANSGFRALGCGKWVSDTWTFVQDAPATSWPPERIKGRYSKVPHGILLNAIRYLDPSAGRVFEYPTEGFAEGSGFKPGNRVGVWVGSEGFEFTADEVAEAPAPVLGYVVSSSNGAPTVLHRTQKIAEAEALRLAQGNTGVEFTVFPVHCGKAVAKAHTPKPVAKLEKL